MTTDNPLLPHRLDLQIKTLRAVANRLEHEREQYNHEQDEWHEVEYTADGRCIRMLGEDSPILSIVYADGDYLVARRTGMLHVFEVVIREQGGAASVIRRLFTFDPES